MLMAKAVDELATITSGKKAMAIEAFARALRMIPTIIADNAGYDSSELVAQLRAQHYSGNVTAGLDMKQGAIGDVEKLGIVESYKSKLQILLSASEAAGKNIIIIIAIIRNRYHMYVLISFILFLLSNK